MLPVNSYSNLSVEKKAAIWYIVCNIFQKGIAFFVIPLYVRLLTPAEYGQYTIFQSWCSILIIFATLNLYCGVFTKAMVDYHSDRDRYTSSMQGLSTIITFFLFFLYLVMQKWWNRILEMDFNTICLMFCYFIAFPAFSFWSVRQRVENKYKKMVLITLLQSVATPFIGISLLLYSDLRVNAVIWGFLITQTFFGFYFYIYHFVNGRSFYHKEYWLHAIKYNIPLIPHYLSLVVLGQIDRILIGNYCGKDKAGIYSLAYQVSMIINVVVSGINGSYVPWIYEKFKKRDYELVKNQSNKLCVLVTLLTVSAMLLTPEFVFMIGTEEYYAAIWIIPAVCVSVFFQFCYGLFACVEFYYDATRYVMIATTIGACLSVGMNILLLPRFGYLAAGYTSLCCYMFFMLLHYIFMRCVCSQQLDGFQIFDNRFICLLCIFHIVFLPLCLLLYLFMILRYLVILILLVIILMQWKKVQLILMKNN